MHKVEWKVTCGEDVYIYNSYDALLWWIEFLIDEGNSFSVERIES